MLSGSRKGLLLFSLLLVASVAGAASVIICEDTDLAAPAVSRSGDLYCTGVCGRTSEFFNPHIATIVAESFSAHKFLNVLPSAIFMSLAEFSCISPVQDRKLRLLVLEGAFPAGSV